MKSPGLALLLAFLGWAPAAFAQTPDYPAAWVIEAEKSRVTFTAEQLGEAFEGRLGAIYGDILFSPENLPLSEAEVKVGLVPVLTGDRERDQYLQGPEWLDTARFPTAAFKTASFVHVGSNRYRADGNLTIRDKTVPVTFRFALTLTGTLDGVPVAIVDGDMTIDRRDFGVGQGQWENADTVGQDVEIHVHLEALRE